MQNSKGFQRQSIYWATVSAFLLLIWLAPAMRNPIRIEDRVRSPGFGWSWDFNYERAMREPQLTLADPINRILAPRPDQFVLTIGNAASIAGLKIIYRGRTASGMLRLGVIDRSLDAAYAYPFELSAAEARKGFTLFDRRFLLETTGPSFIQLRHLSTDNP